MRRFIVQAIADHMVAGHSVTVMCGMPYRMALVHYQVCMALEWNMGVKTVNRKQDHIELENGATLTIGQLQDFTGTSMEHTPFVVLQDIDKANQVLVPEARAIACRFADGKPPIVIEC